jgi:hypothetical protein
MVYHLTRRYRGIPSAHNSLFASEVTNLRTPHVIRGFSSLSSRGSRQRQRSPLGGHDVLIEYKQAPVIHGREEGSHQIQRQCHEAGLATEPLSTVPSFGSCTGFFEAYSQTDRDVGCKFGLVFNNPYSPSLISSKKPTGTLPSVTARIHHPSALHKR